MSRRLTGTAVFLLGVAIPAAVAQEVTYLGVYHDTAYDGVGVGIDRIVFVVEVGVVLVVVAGEGWWWRDARDPRGDCRPLGEVRQRLRVAGDAVVELNGIRLTSSVPSPIR